VNGLVQVLDRLRTMAMEFMFGRFQMVFRCAHRFQSFVNVRMRRRRCSRPDRERESEENKRHQQNSQERDFLHTILLVRFGPGRSLLME